MAVFMVNICKYNGCGLTFPSLADLIQHIEDTHIDYDPRVVEQKELQQPACLPLSYVLRFFTDAARKEVLDSKRKLVQNHGNKPAFCSVRSNTPTGSEADEEEVISESEDSNDSWTTPEEFSAEFILRYGSRMLNPSNQNNNNNNNVDKPFACPVPGCKKRYKNVNGIKYHSKNGHKKDGKVRKGFKCHCGKSYKTGQGLKNHTIAHHSGANLTTLTTQSGEVLQIPTSHVAALQPLRAVALKQISATSLSGIKTIQGLVVATAKPGEATSKGSNGDAGFDAIAFTKGSAIQMAVPTFVPSQKGTSGTIAGLVVNSVSATTIPQPEQTLGVLTPATSPQTPADCSSSTPGAKANLAPSNSSPNGMPVAKQLSFLPPNTSSPAVATQTPTAVNHVTEVKMPTQ